MRLSRVRRNLRRKNRIHNWYWDRLIRRFKTLSPQVEKKDSPGASSDSPSPEKKDSPKSKKSPKIPDETLLRVGRYDWESKMQPETPGYKNLLIHTTGPFSPYTLKTKSGVIHENWYQF